MAAAAMRGEGNCEEEGYGMASVRCDRLLMAEGIALPVARRICGAKAVGPGGVAAGKAAAWL